MELICARCEKACHITMKTERGEIRTLSGHQCERGKEYAETELLLNGDEEEP